MIFTFHPIDVLHHIYGFAYVEPTCMPEVVVVKSLSHVQLFVTPQTTVSQASLSLTIFWSSPKFTSIELKVLCNHLVLCHSLLLLLSIFPRTRVFSSESVVHIRWQKYWSFSFTISPSMSIQGCFPLGLTV